MPLSGPSAPDGRRPVEIEGRALHLFRLARRDHLAVNRQVAVGVDRQLMLQDIARRLARKVPINVIGEVHVGRLVGIASQTMRSSSLSLRVYLTVVARLPG